MRAPRILALRLEMLGAISSRNSELGELFVVSIVPVPEVAAQFHQSARTWAGREIEITASSTFSRTAWSSLR